MEDLRRKVISYVNGLVEERLANDPDRLDAFHNLAAYFDNNRNCTHLERNQMIQQMFGEQNQDLALVYFPAVQQQYETALREAPLLDQAARLLKLAKMCYCIQFMDLYRQRFDTESSYYTVLSNAVNLFIADRIHESQLCAHLNHVLLDFPEFLYELGARVNRITSLFTLGGGGWGGNNPGAGNPPPQA